MKKNLFVLIATIVLLSIQSKAQLGLHVGYNFAKLSGVQGSVGSSEAYLSNFSGGAFFDKDLIPLLDLRIGLMYSPKGSQFENGDDYSKTIMNYLELPLLAKLKLGPIYGLGGFYGAYALGGKSKTKILGIESSSDLDFDATNIKRFDYGMKFGLGLQIGLGPVHIFAQGDYSFGLANLNDSGVGDEMKNNVIGVSAGVLLGFK